MSRLTYRRGLGLGTLCDRIVVLLRGRVVADLRRDETDVQDIVMWITGAALSRN